MGLATRLRRRFPQLTPLLGSAYFPKRYPIISSQVGHAVMQQSPRPTHGLGGSGRTG